MLLVYSVNHALILDATRDLPTGIPDAPVEIQVEIGPQEGSLLVTWSPVTLTSSGKSNGAVVTGYCVYIDGTRMKEVYSATGKLSKIPVDLRILVNTLRVKTCYSK